MPVRIKTTRQYMAISPNMNDQWSGKILSRAVRAKWAAPRRSSNQRPSRPMAPRGSRPRRFALTTLCTALVEALEVGGDVARLFGGHADVGHVGAPLDGLGVVDPAGQ